VAARQTLAAFVGFLKINRKHPGTKGNTVADMFRVVRGVGIMTCSAGSPLYVIIDMNEMKVLFAVPKTGQSGGKLLTGDGLLMTHKTELIIIFIVGGIENRREVFPQYPEIIGSMGRMAG